ncbi:MAG: VWA domain-containing protein [Bacteroidota bacterium]
MKRILIALLCVFSTTSFLQVQAQNTPSPIIFIYDASGSMWGQMEGKTKMQIAGKVLSEALDNLPAQQQIGLVAYGHRRKKDCQDVETLVSMDNQDKEQVRLSLGNIKPLGRTPLAFSAEQVIDQLRSSGKQATIILITDGIESCNGDLCEVVKKAKAEGINFKLHIIGFGLKDGETEALKCAAEAGDGQYYDAADAGSLDAGLNEATTATVDTVQFEAPEKPLKNYSVFATKNGEPIDVWVKAIPIGQERELTAVRTYADTGFLSLPEGYYDLKFQPLGGSDLSPVTASKVPVSPDSANHYTMAFDAGKISAMITKNGEGVDASIRVYAQGTNKEIASTRTYAKAQTIEVDPGVYDIAVKVIGVKGEETQYRFEGIVVKPAGITDLSYDFGAGKLSSYITSNQEGWDAVITVLDPSTGKQVGQTRTYGKVREIEISSGTYNVRIKAIDIKGSAIVRTVEGVTISSNETTKVEEDFPHGQLSVKVQSGGQLIDATVNAKEITTNKSFAVGRTYTTEKTNPRIKNFLPGTYEVTVKALGALKGQKKTVTAEVRAGETMELVVEY